MTFIHYSANGKKYHSKDFDSINRTGIEITSERGKTKYTANTLTEFRNYKTLKGAERFMERSGRKAVAVEDGKRIIYLTGNKPTKEKR